MGGGGEGRMQCSRKESKERRGEGRRMEKKDGGGEEIEKRQAGWKEGRREGEKRKKEEGVWKGRRN